MTNIKSKKCKILNIFYPLLLIVGILLLIILPQLSIDSFYMGLRIWATKVLPALLPFFILTRLLSFTSTLNTIGKAFAPITKKLYGVGGISGYVFIMSIISGYPIGAKLTADLYKDNTINSKQAQTITAFTSTSGPLFIIGTVAIGMYSSQAIGILILSSHILGAMLNGLLYRNKAEIIVFNTEMRSTGNHLQECMSSSILSIMIVGGFISIFYMFLQIILQLNTLYPIIKFFEMIGINSSITKGMFAGLIEVTTGCLYLGQAEIPSKLLLALSTFLISFGGLSIHAQAYTFLKEFDMPYIKFLLIKFTQAIISTIIAILLGLIFL